MKNDHIGKRVLVKKTITKSKVIQKVTKIADRSYECDQCQMTFGNNSNFDKHQRTMHNPENELLNCDMCDFVTKSQGLLKSHSESHRKCNKCDFVGGDRMDLRGHILARHREKGMLLPQYTTLKEQLLSQNAGLGKIQMEIHERLYPLYLLDT